MIDTREYNSGVDLEWMQLILEAKKIGIEKEDIREFLNKYGTKELMIENR